METNTLQENVDINNKPIPFHTSYIEISQEALRHNINFLTELFGENVIFSSVVKGNAYGHGIDVFVPLAEVRSLTKASV